MPALLEQGFIPRKVTKGGILDGVIAKSDLENFKATYALPREAYEKTGYRSASALASQGLPPAIVIDLAEKGRSNLIFYDRRTIDEFVRRVPA